jgi:hypothetical protein
LRLDNGDDKSGKSAEISRNRRIDGRPKSAAPTRPKSRWLRCNDRFDRKYHDRPKCKPGDSRGVKIEIAPLYMDMRTSAQKYTFGSVIVLLRNASPCLRKARSGP